MAFRGDGDARGAIIAAWTVERDARAAARIVKERMSMVVHRRRRTKEGEP